jgi:hypothetical protein
MRIAISKEDKGHVPDPEKYQVYLDGKLQLGCVMADSCQGVCLCQGTDFLGQPTELRKGDVEIVKVKP